ncbi:MAG: hypothetical protein KH240_04280 [Faecalibacterium prausnitzii]|nr:hypothetical protein [Faecalibacterium prausnitzii]
MLLLSWLSDQGSWRKAPELLSWLSDQGSWRKAPERFYNIRFPHRGADIFSTFDFISETFL